MCKHYAAVINYHPTKDNGKPSTLMPQDGLSQEEHKLFYDAFDMFERETALKEAQRGKSPGPDGILPEFLVNLGSAPKEVVLLFLNSI